MATMVPNTFTALVVRTTTVGTESKIEDVDLGHLPPGNVLVRVRYSSLNYKDALAVTGRGKVIRSFPMVPGIDLAGEVVESFDWRFHPGDAVLATGFGVGEERWGGFGEYARLPGDLLSPVPAGLTPREAMGIGTAGLTAMLSVMALEEHGLPTNGRNEEVVVSGAAGGVGSIAVALLAQRGFHVTAVTGRREQAGFLRDAGAHEVVSRENFCSSVRPLERERWRGGVDVAGGITLVSMLRQLARGASVAACGLAGSAEFSGTVFPFILRGVNLLGIESVHCPLDRRAAAWQRLAQAGGTTSVVPLVTEIPLDRVELAAKELLSGKIRGRVVVRIGA